MLPILRIIPVGGVLLAIAIMLLALSPPDGAHPRLTRVDAPARGPLVNRNTHPEWRQFLILAALRRADELERLRELPDTPARSGAAADTSESTQPGTGAAPQQIAGPEALATETAARQPDAGSTQPDTTVASLPAAPVAPVERSEVMALREPAEPGDAPAAPAVQPEPMTAAPQPADPALPVERSDVTALREPAEPGDARAAPAVQPEPMTAAPQPADDPVLPVERSDVVASPQPAEPGDAPAVQPEATHVAALSVGNRAGDADDETGSIVPSQDGAAASADDADKAAASLVLVVLPRGRPPGIEAELRHTTHVTRQRVVHPVRATRPARHVRATRTAANEPATFNFFEVLLRMFSANARPPAAANGKRRNRSLN